MIQQELISMLAMAYFQRIKGDLTRADIHVGHGLFSENVEVKKGERTRKGFIEGTYMLCTAYFQRT